MTWKFWLGIFLTGSLWAAPAPEKIKELVQTARSLPPELAADVMLRVAESEQAKDKGWKLELYESAFQLAGSVRQLGPRKLAYNLPDSSQRFEGLAAGLGLDRMSIQLRAIGGILPQQPARARELFGQVTPPEAAKLTCADALVNDPSLYYRMLGEIFEQAYTAEERARQEPVRMLLAVVQSATSSVQLAPLAKLLAEVRMTPQQRELLESTFAARLEAANDDDRTYTYAVMQMQLAPRVNVLIRDGVGGGDALSEGWKSFVTRQEKGPRCQGVLTEHSAKLPGTDTNLTAAMPLDRGGTLPSNPDMALHVTPYPADDEARSLTEKVRGLYLTSAGQLYTPEQRKETEWRTKALAALSAVDGWQPGASTNAIDAFHETLALYRGLLQMGAGAEFEQRVLESYVTTLSGSSIATEHPSQWLVELNILLDLARTPRGVPSQGTMRAAILKRLAQSSNPAAEVYSNLETAVPAGVAEWRGMGVK